MVASFDIKLLGLFAGVFAVSEYSTDVQSHRAVYGISIVMFLDGAIFPYWIGAQIIISCDVRQNGY